MTTEKWAENQDELGYEDFAKRIDTYIGNTGNLMFLESCRYLLNQSGNEWDFYSWHEMNNNEKKYKEKINAEYDLVFYPVANILRKETVFIENIVSLLEGINIPIYLIGVGLSIKHENEIALLAKTIREPLTKLIKIVEESGGKFACRGYYTERVFEILGYKEAIVTGCPSMYQNGMLHISKKNEKQEKLKVGINGYSWECKKDIFRKAIEEYQAMFFDQGEFLDVLYQEEYETKKILKKFSNQAINMILSDQIRLFYKLPMWSQYISENIDIMLGTRAHGNLVTLLSGKPAALCWQKGMDIRVKEIAEFYKIPIIDLNTKESIESIYETLNYDEFNRNFCEKFENFEKFLTYHKICNFIPKEKNSYLLEKGSTLSPILNREQLFEELQKVSIKDKVSCKMYYELRRLREKYRR